MSPSVHDAGLLPFQFVSETQSLPKEGLMRVHSVAGRRGFGIVVIAAVITTIGVAGTGCGGTAVAGAAGKGFRAVPDRVTRLVIDVDLSFDDFKSRYEQVVPAFSPDKIAILPDWNAVVARTAEIAPMAFSSTARSTHRPS
jgi:hypothetical protein